MCWQKSSCFQLLLYGTDISQGSVATHLRCGGIFSNSVITNFLLTLTVKNFENRLIFGKVMAYQKMVPFLGHPVVTSAEEGGYVFTSVCLSVCLSVCPSHNWKNNCERILTKFLGWVGHGPGTNELNFADDPDHRPDRGVRSPKSGFTGLSNYQRIWWNFMESWGVA